MAPLPTATLTTYFTALLRRTSTSPIHRRAVIESGVIPPEKINSQAIFGLFGLIGVGFVITGIWFFFFAKNGGFYFHENDWEDYKSTVLRRKGPNGTTLSGATESTDLGGGSVVHGQGKRSVWGGRKGAGKKIKKKGKRYRDYEEGSTIGSEISGTTLTTEMSELPGRGQKKSKLHQSIEADNDDGDIADEETRLAHDVDVRAYRHEKPARVGGLNKQPDGSAWDGSTDASTAASELLANRERTPTSTPTKKRERKDRQDTYTGGTGGIRKVVSVSAGGGESERDRERDRVKLEAAKLQEKGRAAQRRDFSFRMGDDVSATTTSETSSRREHRRGRSPSKRVPGSYMEDGGSTLGSDLSSDIGTKSYHHPIPGLAAGSETYTEERREERRKRRGAEGRYRRE